jgi:hypothetical protein
MTLKTKNVGTNCFTMKSVCFLLSTEIIHDPKIDLVERWQLSVTFPNLFQQGHRKMLTVDCIGIATNLVCLL